MQLLVPAVPGVRRRERCTEGLGRGNAFPLASSRFAHSHLGTVRVCPVPPKFSRRGDALSAPLGVRLSSSAYVPSAASDQSSPSSEPRRNEQGLQSLTGAVGLHSSRGGGKRSRFHLRGNTGKHPTSLRYPRAAEPCCEGSVPAQTFPLGGDDSVSSSITVK